MTDPALLAALIKSNKTMAIMQTIYIASPCTHTCSLGNPLIQYSNSILDGLIDHAITISAFPIPDLLLLFVSMTPSHVHSVHIIISSDLVSATLSSHVNCIIPYQVNAPKFPQQSLKGQLHLSMSCHHSGDVTMRLLITESQYS